MAEDEKRPFTRPEALGESVAKMGTNDSSPGAGARKAEEASDEDLDQPREHQRVISGAETSTSRMDADSEATMRRGESEEAEAAMDVSDEEFRQALDALQAERERGENAA